MVFASSGTSYRNESIMAIPDLKMTMIAICSSCAGGMMASRARIVVSSATRARTFRGVMVRSRSCESSVEYLSSDNICVFAILYGLAVLFRRANFSCNNGKMCERRSRIQKGCAY